MTFSIVADSSTDVLGVISNTEQLFVVPTLTIFGEQEYRNGELTTHEFLRKLEYEIPKTSQPNPQDYLDGYMAAIDACEGPAKVLGIHISSKLSGTFSGAISTKQYIEEEGIDAHIEIVDSLNVSFGAGYLVAIAVEMRERGYSLDEVIAVLEETKHRIHLEILIEDIDQLVRGGRVNIAASMILKLLRLKPIISNEDGLIVRNSLAFGRASGMKKILSRAIKYEDVGDDPSIIIGHANTPEDLGFLRDQLIKQGYEIYREMEIGTTLIVHGGPGVLGVMVAPGLDDILNRSDV